MSNTTIGEKKSFWQLINGAEANNILIPTIQRDYTYGSNTEDTNKVVNNMLENIKQSLFETHKEMTMNFVYGYTEEKKIDYVPLDGQQRLTTLFLLYYYAALYGEGDFEKLKKFTYATRETTKNYCRNILTQHQDILNNIKNTGSLNKSIRDMSWYLPSFDSDPSIRSMQVVLGRIENKFYDVKEKLWKELTSILCPVNFYQLDFGPFGLSDDLYVKMNSRGKKLTEYEIFKSMFLKHIEKTIGDKSLKTELALKFDNEWTDLVWETIGRPDIEEKLCEIDKAYIRLMKLIIRFLSYKKGTSDTNIKLNLDTTKKYIEDKKQIAFIEDFLDTFCWAQNRYKSIDNAIKSLYDNIILIKKEKNAFKVCLEGKNITNGDALFLYGSFLALKLLKNSASKEERLRLNIRHLRNIIENSDNEIRDDNMPKLIVEVEEIMTSHLDNKSAIYFNTNQWLEEYEKEEHIDEWKKLWKYEEHEFLRGSLSAFAYNQKLDLTDKEALSDLILRLDKFEYIFDQHYADNDQIIRAALLTFGDYTQYIGNNNSSRIIGNIPLCWRNMLVKKDNRHNQKVIMEVIDKITVDSAPVQVKMQDIIESWIKAPTTDKTNWRYYAIKYSDYNYVAYTYNDGYGYYCIDQSSQNTLNCAILQSSYFGASNVAWFLLNHILYEKNKDIYHITLYTHAAKSEEKNIYLSFSQHNDIQLGISQKGWIILGITEQEMQSLAIKNIESHTEKDGSTWLTIKPDGNYDYIEWAELYILKPLEMLNGFKK